MPKGIRLTEAEQARRRREIFDASVRLFLSKGFSETSMREIAAAAGIGKSTLYGYFRTKDDVLVFVVEEELAELNRRGEAIARQPGSADERLRRLLHMHLATLVANRSYFLHITNQVQRLHADRLGAIQARRYAYQDLIRTLVEEGIQEGVFRPVNAFVAARILLALMMPVVWTTRPVGTPEEMLGEALDICLNGLRA
jgi:TetR/AcrR family transcriptional regulator, cholesterol catabolism regulator